MPQGAAPDKRRAQQMVCKVSDDDALHWKAIFLYKAAVARELTYPLCCLLFCCAASQRLLEACVPGGSADFEGLLATLEREKEEFRRSTTAHKVAEKKATVFTTRSTVHTRPAAPVRPSQVGPGWVGAYRAAEAYAEYSGTVASVMPPPAPGPGGAVSWPAYAAGYPEPAPGGSTLAGPTVTPPGPHNG